MGIYRVRLEDKASGEFRLVAVSCDSEDEARAVCERIEARHVGYELTADLLAEYEADEAAGKLAGRGKARLHSHRQQAAYKIVSVEAAA